MYANQLIEQNSQIYFWHKISFIAVYLTVDF